MLQQKEGRVSTPDTYKSEIVKDEILKLLTEEAGDHDMNHVADHGQGRVNEDRLKDEILNFASEETYNQVMNELEGSRFIQLGRYENIEPHVTANYVWLTGEWYRQGNKHYPPQVRPTRSNRQRGRDR